MELPRLYLITDRYKTGRRPLLDVLEEALEGGVSMIQLREKDLSGKELFELAEKVREITYEHKAKLLINDRIDVAMAVEADGVHLPSDSFRPAEARELLGEGPLIGYSSHSVDEALDAEKEGADFITFSPIYHTPAKASYGDPQGLERLEEVSEKLSIPLFALGGIDASRIDDVMENGAYGVAMISAIIAAKDVRSTTGNIISKIRA